MLKRVMVFGLAVVLFSAPALLAQRGGWEVCVFSSAKKTYTDQQIGGLLLHDSATLVKEASRAIAKARTPQERRVLSGILTRACRDMDEIALIMKGKRLTQKDIDRFHGDITRLKRQIRTMIR